MPIVISLLLAIAQEQPVGPPGELPLRFGGRFQADWAAAGGAALDAIGAARGEAVDSGGGEVRRARLRADWNLAAAWYFRADFDFARGDARPREVALSWTPERGEEWKLGFAKAPFGFERMMSSNDFDLVEESAVEQAIPPGRRMGLFGSAWTPEWTAAGAAYQVADSRARVERGSRGAGARAAWRPWRESGGCLVHLAAAAAWEDPDGATSFAANPEQHLLGGFLDSGKLPTGAYGRAGVEAAAAAGPAFALLEAFAARPDDPAGGNAAVAGWTASAGAFLTGERRAYDDAKACWGRTRPLAEFDPADPAAGAGAWEIVARASRLDLGAAAGAGPAELTVWSLGAVWHWTPHRRWLLTVSRIELDGFDAVHAATLRFAVDW
jgi:phosphate-selective porin